MVLHFALILYIKLSKYFGVCFLFLKFKKSVLELRNVKNICLLSFFAVLKIIISSFKIAVAPHIYISFGFLVYIFVGGFFGPFCSVVFAIVTHILSFAFVSYTSFHFGFLISSIVSCFIYSLFLYKQEFRVKRGVLGTIVNDFVVHFFLNIIWLSQLFHDGDFFKSFVIRVPKGFIMLFVDCFLAFLAIVFIKKLSKTLKFNIN